MVQICSATTTSRSFHFNLFFVFRFEAYIQVSVGDGMRGKAVSHGQRPGRANGFTGNGDGVYRLDHGMPGWIGFPSRSTSRRGFSIMASCFFPYCFLVSIGEVVISVPE